MSEKSGLFVFQTDININSKMVNINYQLPVYKFRRLAVETFACTYIDIYFHMDLANTLVSLL